MDADPTILSIFFPNNSVFNGSASQIVVQLRLLMDLGMYWGYSFNPSKSLFIVNNPEEEETARREFNWAGLNLNHVDGSRYLEVYLGPKEELEAWVQPKVEAWARRGRILDKIAKRYPQVAFSGLRVSFQLECQYLQMTVTGVGNLMGPIEDALREEVFLALFIGEEVNTDSREILYHSVKHSGVSIPDPHL